MADELLVTVETEYESDLEELAALTQNLRQHLLLTDVQDVRPAQSGDLPPGAKAAAAIDWNSLLVALGGSGGVLASLVGALMAWIRRHQGATLQLRAGDCEVALTGAGVDLAQVQQLLEVCLGQGGDPPVTPGA